MANTAELTEKEIGKKLRYLRQKKKMTLKELAKEAGCTDAALSKIERGEVAPTISLLKNAVNGLGTTLSEFLLNGSKSDESIVMRENERIQMKFPTEKIISYQLVRNLKTKQMQPLYEVIKPGGGSHGFYKHEGEEFGLVLEGELEITVNDVDYTIGKGDSFYYKSNQPHAFANKSAANVIVLWIITPPTF
jgi:transcriptional regulator with XRE-family HTH domain